MRFVHTADNHLDMPSGALSPEKKVQRRAQRRSSFSKIIDFTIENNADFLLISGDLFHTPSPSPSTVSFCINEFERLGSIPVFIALGNHDYLASLINFPGNVHVFSPAFETLECNGAFITGASFDQPAPKLAAAIPRASRAGFNILCLHGNISPTSEYNPMDKDLLTTLGYDYIALGHVHEYTKYKNIVYPGCHDGGGFDEKGIKGFIFARYENNTSQIEFVPSSSLIYEEITFDISDCTSSLAVAAALEKQLSADIYKIILTGNTQNGFVPNTKTISDALSHKAFHIKIEDNSSPLTDLSSSRLYAYFCEYISAHAGGQKALSAQKLGIAALKGDDLDL